MTITIPTVPLSVLIDHGRVPALLAFFLAILCVILMGMGAFFPALLSIASPLSTIAELCVGFGTTVSAGHSVIQAWERVKTNGHNGGEKTNGN